MTKRITVDDENGEWLEINQKLQNAVAERALENNEKFGDAFREYLNEQFADDGDN